MRPHALALLPALAALGPISSRAATTTVEDSLGGPRVFLASFSVQTPAGNWTTKLDVENDRVSFEQEKLGAVRFLTGFAQGSSGISVFSDRFGPSRWALDEAAAAAVSFDDEERTMRTQGVARGLYQIKQITRDTTWIGDRRFHVLSYVNQAGQAKIQAALYLWFPPDYPLTHRCYGFHISEATRGIYAKAVVERILPVIRSFRLESPEPLDDPVHQLLLACARGDTARAGALVRAGGDVNARLEHGTPLVLAAAGRKARMVDWLLAHGADPQLGMQTSDLTALMGAAAAADHDIVLTLLDHGAPADQRSADSTTALMLAAETPGPDIVRLLVEHGASVDARDDAGVTALMLAAGQGREPTVAYLLDKGAAVNGAMRLGWTALHRAAEAPHPRVVALLLAKGADPNLASRNGWTALMSAVREQDVESVRALIGAGAAVNARSALGTTPARLAKDGKSSEIRTLLKQAGAK